MVKRRGFRNLVLASGTWQFKIGRSYVVIFSPNGDRYCPSYSKITGLSSDSIERSRRKRTSDANILPSTIRKWIESELITI